VSGCSVPADFWKKGFYATYTGADLYYKLLFLGVDVGQLKTLNYRIARVILTIAGIALVVLSFDPKIFSESSSSKSPVEETDETDDSKNETNSKYRALITPARRGKRKKIHSAEYMPETSVFRAPVSEH
jgi:hypothetical protein